MIKVYFKELPEVPLIPLAFLCESSADNPYKNLPFKKRALEQLEGSFIERVSRPEDADFLLLPHNYKRVQKKEAGYLRELTELARKINKKIIVFAFQDSAEPIDWPEAFIFRVSAYASQLEENEYVMPYVVEDLCEQKDVQIRPLPKKPAVGFVGWAVFDTYVQALRSTVREALYMCGLFAKGVKNIGNHRKGVFVRREMIWILNKDKRIQKNFILRDKYGGSVYEMDAGTIEKMRYEYIENILESDVVLAPRGDGNGSQRFYEVLSLGRIPLLIDTDMRLPFEDFIPYERFVIRVPYKERKKAADYVIDFFEGLDDVEYEKRQREARYYFENYLSLNGFYNYLFNEEKIKELTGE